MIAMNHIEREYQYLLSQYKQSTLLTGTINCFLAENQDIENNIQLLFNTFNVNVSSNEQLDFLGLLLGVSRFYIPDDDNYFQLDVTPLDKGYRFAPSRDIDFRLLTDNEYRAVLKGWSKTLNSLGSTNDLIKSLVNIMDLSSANMVNISETNYKITITLNEDITKPKAYIYDHILPNGDRLFPKVCGTGYEISYVIGEING